MHWQRGTLADFMGHRIVYRNLQPVDPNIPGLDQVWSDIGLERYIIPRKTTIEYARAIWLFVDEAQRQRDIAKPIERALFVGDSARNDGGAARNMGGYRPVQTFIGTDALNAPKSIEIRDAMMEANRWSGLGDFVQWLEGKQFVLDEQTALLIDLDKTSLGARGRNDGIIDLARVRAAERTARQVLGASYDADTFHALYTRLCQSRYHFLTEDNQDYVAYICLMVAGQAYPASHFWQDVADGRIPDIRAFCQRCEAATDEMAARLLAAHRQVSDGIAQDDPTPFKTFRRDEFYETISCMNVLSDSATVEEVLAREIVMTAEVAAFASTLSKRGVMVFGLSDKPDEASIPTSEAYAKGFRSIHDTPMKVYGEEIL